MESTSVKRDQQLSKTAGIHFHNNLFVCPFLSMNFFYQCDSTETLVTVTLETDQPENPNQVVFELKIII